MEQRTQSLRRRQARGRRGTRVLVGGLVVAGLLLTGCAAEEACACEPYDSTRERVAADWFAALADGRYDLAWQQVDPAAQETFGDRAGLRAAAAEWLPDPVEPTHRTGDWLVVDEQRRGADGATVTLLMLTDTAGAAGAETDVDAADAGRARLVAMLAVVTPPEDGTPVGQDPSSPADRTTVIAPLPEPDALRLSVDGPEGGSGAGPQVTAADADGPVDVAELSFVALSPAGQLAWPEPVTTGDPGATPHLHPLPDEMTLLIAFRPVGDTWQYAVTAR